MSTYHWIFWRQHAEWCDAMRGRPVTARIGNKKRSDGVNIQHVGVSIVFIFKWNKKLPEFLFFLGRMEVGSSPQSVFLKKNCSFSPISHLPPSYRSCSSYLRGESLLLFPLRVNNASVFPQFIGVACRWGVQSKLALKVSWEELNFHFPSIRR